MVPVKWCKPQISPFFDGVTAPEHETNKLPQNIRNKSQRNEDLKHVFHDKIFPSLYIQGPSIKLTKMRYYSYFLPPYNQHEPKQKISLPPSLWSLQPSTLKVLADGTMSYHRKLVCCT